MSFRNTYLICWLVLLSCFNQPMAQEDDSQTQALVVVLGESLTADALMPSQTELDALREKAQGNFDALLDYRIQIAAFDSVVERIIFDYAKRNGITADETLVKQFEDKFSNELASSQQRAGETESDTASAKDISSIAQREVTKFLVEKAMYKTFGGRVVFRQSNPLMPVDAYKKLLMQYKESGQLQFNDETLEKAFWGGFSEPFKFVIPTENIDFSNPWWL
ncbi:hypothetical protein [Alteromonas gracilis]|uniref:hypothetical protein n=1 Tax=Alteromonas gracilis TaxID=1479524 RepID=UPI0030D60928